MTPLPPSATTDSRANSTPNEFARVGVRATIRHTRRVPVGVLLPVIAVTVLSLSPMIYIVWVAIEVGYARGVELIFRDRVATLLTNTVALLATTVPLTLVLGVGTAWVVERTDLPGRRVLGIVLAAPLAIPAFVAGYAWLGLIPSIGGLWGGTLIAVTSYYPLVYLPAAATFRRLDPALEEVATSLGFSALAVTVRVVLPQLRLSVLGGILLVALHLLAEYGAFAMIRFDTFTTAIVQQYRSTFASDAGSMLAGVLVVICLAFLLAESLARGRGRYARLGSGTAQRPRPVHLGSWTPLVWVGIAAVAVASTGVPVYVLARWLVYGGTEVWANPDLWPAVSQSVGYALYGSVGCVLLAIPVAWLSIRYPGPTSRVVEATSYITSSLPGIVVALALTTISVRVLPEIYQTVWLVLAAYILLYIPRAVVTLRAGLAQAPIPPEEAARSLGRSPLAAVLAVTVPRLLPALSAAFALVFLAVVTELTATLLLSPAGTATLATEFWALSLDLNYAAAAPFAVIMVVLSAPMTYLLLRQSAAEDR